MTDIVGLVKLIFVRHANMFFLNGFAQDVNKTPLKLIVIASVRRLTFKEMVVVSVLLDMVYLMIDVSLALFKIVMNAFINSTN